MERPRLYLIRNRLLAVEVAGMALFSLSAWVGGAVGLGTGAIVGATAGAPATGAVIGGLVGTGFGYVVGKSFEKLRVPSGQVPNLIASKSARR
jgi:hypothetical protein